MTPGDLVDVTWVGGSDRSTHDCPVLLISETSADCWWILVKGERILAYLPEDRVPDEAVKG